MFWILTIYIFIFLGLITILFLYLKYHKRIKTLEKDRFETENEYLKKFIPIFEENKTNSYIFSGAAGSGKTSFINEFTRYLNFNKLNYKITSSTWVSIANFKDGQTIHTFSGIGNLNFFEDIERKILNPIFVDKLRKKIEKLDILIIDEISMINQFQFEAIDKLFRKILKNNKSFGGIKILLFGDFMQLPPTVSKELINEINFKRKLSIKNYINYYPWIFKYENWNQMNFIYLNLNKIYRQNNKKYIEILNKIRFNKIPKNINEILKLYSKKDENTQNNAITIASLNIDVDKINEKRFNENIGSEFIYNAKITIYNKNHIENLKRKVTKEKLKKIIKLKINTRVMYIGNSPKEKLTNGSLGTVVKLTFNQIFVKWDITNSITSVNRRKIFEWDKINNNYGAIFEQFPLDLAYAITVHKSQGMSLEYFNIYFNSFFENGQAYVALSRATDPRKMYIKFNGKINFKADKESLQFYKTNNWINLHDTKKEELLNIKNTTTLKEKINFKDESRNMLWKDEKWVKNFLIKTNIVNDFEFDYYKEVAGIYKFEVKISEKEKAIYVGQSQNLMQRLCYHIDNAYSNVQIKNKQKISKAIGKSNIENVYYEVLTPKNFFINKYILKEDWDLLGEKEKRRKLKLWLLYEENLEIKKLKKQKHKVLNRTHGFTDEQ